MNKFVIYFIPLFFLFLIISCGGGGFHNNDHKVIEILDGNSIKVRNGVTIHLIGIEDTEDSYEYLQHSLLNKEIRIRYDSQKFFRVKNKNDEVYAYVKLGKKSVNGEILKLKLSGVNNLYLNDSIVIFKEYVYGEYTIDEIYSNNTTDSDSNSNNSSNKTLQDLVKQTEPAVFLVITYDNGGNSIGSGTGFFVDKNGTALSNYHVFDGGSSWQIKTRNEKYYNVSNSDILDYDKNKDFIIFRVGDNIKNPSILKLSNTLPSKGEDIFVLGNPQGLESTVTKGVVSAIRTWYSKDDFIQIDAPISPGSSGSPVLNMKGEVVGIATLKIMEDCESCNFAINIDLVKRKLNNY